MVPPGLLVVLYIAFYPNIPHPHRNLNRYFCRKRNVPVPYFVLFCLRGQLVRLGVLVVRRELSPHVILLPNHRREFLKHMILLSKHRRRFSTHMNLLPRHPLFSAQPMILFPKKTRLLSKQMMLLSKQKILVLKHKKLVSNAMI